MSALSNLLSRVARMVKVPPVPSSFAGTFFVTDGVALDLLLAELSGKSSTGGHHFEEACFPEFLQDVLLGFLLFFFLEEAVASTVFAATTSYDCILFIRIDGNDPHWPWHLQRVIGIMKCCHKLS
jgi:hypothetical protein